jgi:Stress responsive A/B Barrel Domain
MTMIRHVVLMSWTDATTPEKVRQVIDELSALGPKLSGLRDYHAGSDAGINDGNFDFAVVADFDDAASYVAYRDDPGHRDIVSRLITPMLRERVAVQYEV